MMHSSGQDRRVYQNYYNLHMQPKKVQISRCVRAFRPQSCRQSSRCWKSDTMPYRIHRPSCANNTEQYAKESRCLPFGARSMRKGPVCHVGTAKAQIPGSACAAMPSDQNLLNIMKISNDCVNGQGMMIKFCKYIG